MWRYRTTKNLFLTLAKSIVQTLNVPSCYVCRGAIGNYCISHHGKQFSTLVGYLNCLGQKFYNDTAQETQWWGTPKHMELQPHPLANFSNLKTACIVLPYFFPLVIWSIRSIIEANLRCLQDHSGNSADRLPTRCYYNLLPTTSLVCKWSLGKSISLHSWEPHKFPNSSQTPFNDAPTQQRERKAWMNGILGHLLLQWQKLSRPRNVWKSVT
jgi:hypothetical protein